MFFQSYPLTESDQLIHAKVQESLGQLYLDQNDLELAEKWYKKALRTVMDMFEIEETSDLFLELQALKGKISNECEHFFLYILKSYLILNLGNFFIGFPFLRVSIISSGGYEDEPTVQSLVQLLGCLNWPGPSLVAKTKQFQQGKGQHQVKQKIELKLDFDNHFVTDCYHTHLLKLYIQKIKLTRF